MKCFYHKSDLDGHCSGAIVNQMYPGCEMIGVDYSDKLDRDSIDPDETVFIVDFSFPREDMKFLIEILKGEGDLIWIDHHESAIRKCEGLGHIQGERQIGRAGCELTWLWLRSNPMPYPVRLLGRYDVWDHKDPQTLPFQYGLRMRPHLPDAEIWSVLLGPEHQSSHLTSSVIKEGGLILRYQTQQNEMYAKGMAYDAIFEGFRVIVMNRAYSNSQAFDSVYDPDKHDFMAMYGVKPGEYKYSLYSVKPEINVAKIAEQYGGGGHRGAAGFYSDKLVV